MRKPFLETITELAEKDPKVILIVGDVGFTFMEPFMNRFPNQFLNAGAAEQNMMGVAVGMSFEGWKPYVYTMINFICMRPFEQVRNDIAYQNANVKLFGVKGGASYGFLGFSHNIQEDIPNGSDFTIDEDELLMDYLPNMKTHFPKEESEVPELIKAEYARSGPAYFRI